MVRADGSSSSSPPADGRRARGARTRTVVAAAVLGLLQEDNLRPTRAQVADRAGVSLRLVHHHFRQREELYAAAARLQNDRISAQIQAVSTRGSFENRLRDFALARARVLEAITPVRRAVLVQEPFSLLLQTSLAAWRHLKREQAAQVFATELERFSGRIRVQVQAAVACAASWSAWNELRRNQGLELDDARRVLERSLRSLLRDS